MVLTSGALFLIILVIVILDYLVGLWLGYLNTTAWNSAIPGRLKGIYEEEKYRKQQLYARANYRFGLVSGLAGFLALLLMLLFRGFAFVDQVTMQVTGNPVLQGILFFGILGLASDLLGTPFDIYHTFVIEERFGFNKTTPKTYLLDKLKSWALAAVLGGGLLALIIFVYNAAGNWFWIIAWALVSGISVFITYFYTSLILPLFNKLTPLPDGLLRDAINAYAGKVGFALSNIYTMDSSKRSTKGNAFFSGFGKLKKVVLYDTLVQNHTEDELVSILAHEVGHYRKKHIHKGMIISILHVGVLFFLLSFMLQFPLLSEALGASRHSFQMGLLAFGVLYSPVSMLLGIGMNYISRRHEYQADSFAVKTFGAQPFEDALKKLSADNLSNLTPHPWYVFVNYSHPTLLQRLEAMDELSGGETLSGNDGSLRNR